VPATERNKEYQDMGANFSDRSDGKLFCNVCSRIVANVTTTIVAHIESKIHNQAAKTVMEEV
jgi:hypothetical protein